LILKDCRLAPAAWHKIHSLFIFSNFGGLGIYAW
jgi:hypothetical protein